MIIERAIFSCLKASEGGMSFKDAKRMLEENGIKPVRSEYTCYVGHYGLSVPKEFEEKASDLLFGK